MISVCMATYNGAQYVKAQILSILEELAIDDELIISDDGSVDGTLAIIESIQDDRIKLYHSDKHSPIYNFENAISKAQGEYIFLSDQDDIWNKGRVSEAIRTHKEKGALLVVCKAELTDNNDMVFKSSLFDDPDPVSHSILYNLWKNPYTGNCMSFSRELLQHIMPFPKNIAMHDIWIGLVAQKVGKCVYYSERPLVRFRRHGLNFTAIHKYSVWYKIKYRMKFIKELLKR